MRKDLTFRSSTYYTLYAVEWIAGISVAVLTFTATQAERKYAQDFAIVIWTQNHKVWIFVLAVVSVVAKFSCDQMGKPWAWKAIKELLDIWQGQVFAPIPNASADEHRITIFRRVGRCHNLKGWLALVTGGWKPKEWPVGWFKPIARSQHVSQRNISWFPCFDHAKIGEGFIGVVWRKTGTLRIGPLPDLDPPNVAATKAEYALYATQSRVTEPWLRQRWGKTNARTFCGTKIEKKGSNWGVIIIDSRGDELNVSDDQVALAAAALGKFIERA